MEDSCKYISIRGLKRLCDFKSDSWVSDVEYDNTYLVQLIKEDKLFDGCSIFICSNSLLFFVINILPNIHVKFILVTGMSVKECPKEVLNQEHFFTLINNPYLIKWYSQNNSIQYYPKIVQIPLGLDYHSMYINNKSWSSIIDGYNPVDQETYLIDITKNMDHFNERINKIYVNYEKGNDRYKQREESLKKISPNLMIKNLNKIKRTDTWKNTVKCAFVLSPYGNGMDCHRTWEALILGSIPIIKSKEFKEIYSDLPVLNVEDWSEITQELLDKTMKDFSTRTFNYEKLQLDYWKNIVFK